MTRGFITLATGSEKYYKLARNMLLSYRLFCPNPMPFAIMCDRENEYTALFDQVILLENPSNSYWDKFELLVRAPFDETIFVNSDCLAYADWNVYWDYFADADDFTGCGTNYPIESEKGLFQQGAVDKFNDLVHWKPDIHGGLYFIRRGETCNAVYRDCQYICQHIDRFQWPDYCAPNGDEPILCIAMAANNCHASDADPRNYGIPWEVTQMSVDLFTGKCCYATEWHPLTEEGRMIHWSVRYCSKPLYLFELGKLEIMIKHHLRPSKDGVKLGLKDTLLYRFKLRYFYLCLVDFSRRAVGKLKRICHIQDGNR